MTLFTLSLVVLAALIHATWNLLSKRAADAGPVFVFTYAAVGCVAYLPWLLYLFWSGHGVLSGQAWLFIAISGVVHLVYSLCLQRGYQVTDLSVVYPVARGMGPVFSTIGAFVILGEPVTGFGVTGLIAVVLGIILISTRGRIRLFFEPKSQLGVRWGGLTGLMIATYTVVDAFAVKRLAVHPVVLDWFGNLFRMLLLLPLILRDPAKCRARMRGKWGLAIAVGVLSPMSYILVLWALRLGSPLSVVAPAREMSMMLGVMLGMVVLREQVGFWRTFGCALVIFGVIALTQVSA
ncbi:EamA family transporter [Orrella sp. 11846]|uniref:DMT family transporter n=1 Tax=Orrella sp. 11846 TaxID=3409913 RepID=UPI003B5C6C31